MNLIEYLQYPVFTRAFIGTFIAGAGLSLLGVTILTLNLTTVRFALMHVSLLGAAISMVLGFPPLYGAIAGIIITASILGPSSEYLRVDTGIVGVLFMTGSLGLAFIVFHKTGVPANEAFELFRGNILALQPIDIWSLAILATLIVCVFVLFYQEIQIVLYNSDLAKSLGLPVELIRNGLLLLTGLAIGINLKMIGALLVDAAILLPGATALMISRSLKQTLILSACFGVITQVGGLILAMLFDLPSGATITVTAVIILGIVAMFQRIIIPKILKANNC